MNFPSFAITGIMTTTIFMFAATDGLGCDVRYFNYSSFVCVCNEVHCDSVDPLPQLSDSQYAVYTTSKKSHRLSLSIGNFIRSENIIPDYCSNSLWNSICVDPATTYQTMIGFGGSFTDSSGINIYSLTSQLQDQLLRSYYSSDGLDFNMGRVPIGGCDFSTRAYTYDDDHDGDFNLTHFKLQPEDFDYKIPIIKEATKIRGSKLKLFASPWSAPAWMKNSDNLKGFGQLKGDVGGNYYVTWANYFAKFFQEYKSNGIEFWALTAQNEPTDGLFPFFPFNSMGFLPGMQAAFVNRNLGPILEKAGFGDVLIFVLDDNRPFILPWMASVMSDPLSAKYVSGVALHWYFDEYAPADVIDLTHYLYPNQLIVMTEVSFIHTQMSEPAVKLGDWDRGAEYAEYMIQNFNHWVMGWIDWNLALDLYGGPNWASFNLEGTIIVDKTRNEFYRQPQYYAIGHFSKFIPPGSKRIRLNISLGGMIFNQLSSVAFLTPNNNIIIVILNKSSTDVMTDIAISKVGTIASAKIPQNSIQTYILKSTFNKSNPSN